ncbi:hypothetical protein G7Y89_g943 [Cudoniella acicularis]|uniref:TUG ubiquitin-like domain-containing protein n=1 Tax=Cudoniella acicularis TaxID=354080 RepID=A0A8H4RXZ6_9HELO|nr:hypothetical protein G7Y89_g943 [Cudoniella acicularis]
MASHVVVIDTSFRRQTIKVTPGKFMTELLEEACKKFGLNASNYGIKHNNKSLDLSRTFRQTGLSSGAKLELVLASRSPSVVSIALQLPEALASTAGTRLVDKFPSDTTLWLILRKFESTEGKNLNFTARGVASVESGTSGAGRVFYEMPVLNIMGRELASFSDLQKTLAQLGLNSGSGLIRLGFRKTDQPLEDATAEIGQYFQEISTETEKEKVPQVDHITGQVAEPASTEPTPEDEDMISFETSQDDTSQDPTPYPERVDEELRNPALVQPSNSSTVQAISAPESESMEGILGPDQRPISVFSPPSSNTPKAALQPHNEDDYTPSIVHAKLHQSRLQENSHNRRLPSDAETEILEKEKAARLAATKEVEIKIRFSDQSLIVSPFRADESGADLYRYVKSVIVAEEQPFKLNWTEGKGTRTVPKDAKKKLIKDLGFSGRVLVNCTWEDGASESAKKSPVLKPQFAQSAKELKVPESVAAPADDQNQTAALDKGKGKEGESVGRKLKDGITPKWAKFLGGKK